MLKFLRFCFEFVTGGAKLSERAGVYRPSLCCWSCGWSRYRRLCSDFAALWGLWRDGWSGLGCRFR